MPLISITPLTPREQVLRLIRQHTRGLTFFQITNYLRLRCELKETVKAIDSLIRDGSLANTNGKLWLRSQVYR